MDGCKGRFSVIRRFESLVWRRRGRIAQRDQLPERECFFSERKLWIGVDDQHTAAEDTTDYKALTLNGDHFVFLVEDCHARFDANSRITDYGIR